jgi:hypothetical protein
MQNDKRNKMEYTKAIYYSAQRSEDTYLELHNQSGFVRVIPPQTFEGKKSNEWLTCEMTKDGNEEIVWVMDNVDEVNEFLKVDILEIIEQLN